MSRGRCGYEQRELREAEGVCAKGNGIVRRELREAD